MFVSSLYHQTHVINFHFWMILLLLSFVKNLVSFNNTLYPFIHLVSLSLIQQYYKLYLVRVSAKLKLLSKIYLPTTVTQWWIPPRKYFNWINFGYGDNSSKESYPYSSFNALYEILYCGFTFYLTQFNTTYWYNLSLSFAFRSSVISYLKLSAAILLLMNNNADCNEQNTQALLFSPKKYNLGA